MTKTATTFLLLIQSCLLFAQKTDFRISEIFPIEKEHSYIGFTIRYMGYAMVRGRFDDFNGGVRYNENDHTKTSVSLNVAVKSIDTANEWRDDDLISENWFDASRFPNITFISQQSDVTSNGLIIKGDLTMRGITKSVSFPVSYSPKILKDVRGDSQIIFTGGITINRQDFGIEGKKWAGLKEGITAVSDEVNIEFTILAKQIHAGNYIYWVNNETSPHGKIYSEARSNGATAALKKFAVLVSAGLRVDHETLNMVGLMLQKENKVDDAILIFKRNAELYPESALAFESLAYAMALKNRREDALRYFKLALEKDPGNMYLVEILRHL